MANPIRNEVGTQLASFHMMGLGRPSNPKMAPVIFTLLEKKNIAFLIVRGRREKMGREGRRETKPKAFECIKFLVYEHISVGGGAKKEQRKEILKLYILNE